MEAVRGYGRNGATDGLDLVGRELRVGQTVVKATVMGRSPALEIRKVTRVDQAGIYLDGWHQPVAYSGRLFIIEDGGE